MCKEYRWVISTASVSAAIQSLVWMAIGVCGVLVYFCVLPIDPYVDENDFFRVTLIKLYFEGRKCEIDGSYLGKFEEDYKQEMDLLWPEMVFGVMIVYIILNAFFFVVSLTFYRSRKDPDKRVIALQWSSLSLLLCAFDVLVTYAFVMDIVTLSDYLSKVPENTVPAKVAEVPYIPLALALLASRFIAGWLWNFIIGFIIFMDALCCRNIIRRPPKKEFKPIQNRQMENAKKIPEQPKKIEEPPASPKNGNYNSYFMPTRPDYMEYKKSMETTTRFNMPEKQSPPRDWSGPSGEAYWHPKHLYGKNWEGENEGYVSDEGQNMPDFDHDLKNFEAGQRKIKIVKPPMGKPVDPVEKVNGSGGTQRTQV